MKNDIRTKKFWLIVVFFAIFISCDSFKNPEIQKIKAEVERQNIEKEAFKQQAVEKALELFETDDVSSLEQHFFSEEVVVFKNKKTGVCLPMLFRKGAHEWESFGFFKRKSFYITGEPETAGDLVNFSNLENLYEKYCELPEKYNSEKDCIPEKGDIDSERLERFRKNLQSAPLERWSSVSEYEMTVDEAEKYCENLVEKGHDDWRLPGISELRTLVQNCENTEIEGKCRIRDYNMPSNFKVLLNSQGSLCLGNEECSGIECRGCDLTNDGSYSKLKDTVSLLSSSVYGVDFKNAEIRLIEKAYFRCIRGDFADRKSGPSFELPDKTEVKIKSIKIRGDINSGLFDIVFIENPFRYFRKYYENQHVKDNVASGEIMVKIKISDNRVDSFMVTRDTMHDDRLIKGMENLFTKATYFKGTDATVEMNIVFMPEKKSQQDQLVDFARQKTGVVYKWGGRETVKLPGLDCLGIIYLGLEKICGTAWKKYSVIPSVFENEVSVTAGKNQLVMKKGDLSEAALKKGDILYFLTPGNINDKPLATVFEVYDRNGHPPKFHLDRKPVVPAEMSIRETAYYVSHTGIYTENGNFIHASPFDNNNKVLEENLEKFMIRNNIEVLRHFSFKCKEN